MLKYSMQCVWKTDTKFSCEYVFTKKILGISFRQKKVFQVKWKKAKKNYRKEELKIIKQSETIENLSKTIHTETTLCRLPEAFLLGVAHFVSTTIFSVFFWSENDTFMLIQMRLNHKIHQIISILNLTTGFNLKLIL